MTGKYFWLNEWDKVLIWDFSIWTKEESTTLFTTPWTWNRTWWQRPPELNLKINYDKTKLNYKRI